MSKTIPLHTLNPILFPLILPPQVITSNFYDNHLEELDSKLWQGQYSRFKVFKEKGI